MTEKAIERTAPRRVEDCPRPRAEYMDWRSYRGFELTFTDPRDAVKLAQHLQLTSGHLLDAATLALLAEGNSPAEVAELTGRPAADVIELEESERRTRSRRDYSVAYYERHPDRRPGEWHPVETGDPDLPTFPIGVRTRELEEEPTRPRV
jgi:hypothetical protein